MSFDAASLPAQLAARLIEHIRRENLAVGTHLGEQALARVLNVSRSPVRSALAALAELGIVRQEPHRGCFLRRIPGTAERIGLPAAANRAEERYLAIADDRLAGKLPDDVTETALMRRYGLPRRELQRILHRMEKEGWIERKPGHGWRFAELPDTSDAHAQSYRFRMMFEPAALLEPGFRWMPAEAARVRRDQQMLLDGGVNRLPRSRLFELGSDFHETVMGFSGNRFIVEAIRRVNRMRRLLEYRAHYDRERFAQQCREHLHLLDLLEQGSREDAARYLRRHLDVVRAIKTSHGRPRARAVQTLAAHL